MSPGRGWFISFEGIDGSGKTTQLQLLGVYLQERGHSVVQTREPGGTPIAEQIRELLLHPQIGQLDPRTELLLMEASRAQHVAERIRPALAAGRVVLCDRFADATLAYQGGGRGFPRELLETLNALATDNLQPDITFLLDLEPEIALRRRAAQGEALTRIDQETLDFHRRVRAAYRQLCEEFPERIVLVDARQPIPAVQEQIRTALRTRGLLKEA